VRLYGGALPLASDLAVLGGVNAAAIRRSEAGGVRIKWVRRTRIDGDDWAAGDVPLGEGREAYEIDVLSGATVKRTLSSATPEVLYAATNEIADFGAPQMTLSIRVVQLSATVGRGFAAEATLTNLA